MDASANDSKVEWRSLKDRSKKIKQIKLCGGADVSKRQMWPYFPVIKLLEDCLKSPCKIDKVDSQESSVDEQTILPRLSKKRKQDEIITDLISTVKKECKQQKENKYGHFIGFVCEKLDRLSSEEVDDVQIEILKVINEKIKQGNNKAD